MFEIEKAYFNALATYVNEINEYVKSVLPDLKKEANAVKLIDAIASIPIPDGILGEADKSVQTMISAMTLSELERAEVEGATKISRQKYECAMNEKRLLAKHVFMFSVIDEVVV